MEQMASYNLLQAIDPTKIKVPINERFAKLTLSSNKKQQQKCVQEPDEQKVCKIRKEKRDSVARNISKQFVKEIQEAEANALQNPLLRSESSKASERNNSPEGHAVAEDLTMEPLEVSEDGEGNNAEQVEDNLELLTQQMSNLMVETKPISLSSGSTANLSILTDLLSSESQPSSISEADKIHIVHHIPIIVKEAAKQETISLNFTSSTNGNLEETYIMTEDEESQEDKEEEGEGEDKAITISETSDRCHEEVDDIMATSSLNSASLTSENLSLPSLVADKAERVAAFLRDVSLEHRAMHELGQLVVNDTVDRILDNKEKYKIQESILKARQIATADTESMTPDVGEEITPKSRVVGEKLLKVLEEPEEYKAKNKNKSKVDDKTLDNSENVKFHQNCDNNETPKVIFKPRTPKACATDVFRIANDETQCNTDFSFNEASEDNRTSEKSRGVASLEIDNFSETSYKDENEIKEKLEPCRFANEDTINNYTVDDALTQPYLDHNISQDYKSPERAKAGNCSLISVQLTPTSSTVGSFINPSNEEFNDTVPEASITISESDIDHSLAEEKSYPKEENSDDKKLSNSFHREESSDDSAYEKQLSKIQMGMTTINISAKINIKIRIPQNISSSEDDQNYEQHTTDNDEIVNKQSKRLTDELLTKTSEEEKSFYYEANGQSKSKNQQKSNFNIQNNQALNNKPGTIKKEKSYDKNHSFKSNNEIEFATPKKTCKQIQTKKFKEKSSATTKKTSDSSPEVIEDEKFLTEAEKLLNQLYGKSWQTPDVIRTLKRSSKSGDKMSNNTKSSSVRKAGGKKDSNEEKSDKRSLVVEESVLHDFSMFRQNIVKTNLDSTRLATPKSKMQQKIEALTEPRNRRNPLTQKTGLRPQAQTTERKPKVAPIAKTAVNKRLAYNDRWRQLIDNDSNSEDNNASDDDDADKSWNDSELDVKSSDSDFEISSKSKKRKYKNITSKGQGRSDKSDYLTKILNKSKDGEIVYLDLTKEEVEVQEKVPASPPANHDLTFASRLQDILKTCRHEDKAKLPPSNKKSKRKLFTPQFGDDDFENCDPKEDVNHKEVDKENDVNTLRDNGNCPFDSLGRPKVFDLVNKQLESVKKGQPIFPLTPSWEKKNTEIVTVTPSSKSATKAKSNDEATFKTPSAIKSKTRQTKALKDLWQISDYKYSFLKSLDVTVSRTLCHPDALCYRDNYRTKKEELSKILYDMYNEKLFDNKLQVPLQWNKKLINTAGRCLNKKKLGIRSSVVELSEKVLTSADRLRCTLIHELCHAATWVFNGEGGHGSTWKEWARKANVIFPEIPKIGVCHQYDIEYKYTYKCSLCAAKSHAHSKSKRVENIRCSYCHGAIEVFLNKKDKHGNVTPTPVKEATGFAKFVKDNYKKFKRDDLKHADIMKLLSNEFASLKVTSN